MKIFYLGDLTSVTTSGHRYAALRRLGHEMNGFDPKAMMPKSKLFYALHYRMGYRLLRRRVANAIVQCVARRRYDICWVNSGEYTGPCSLSSFRVRGVKIVSYNNDDPFGGRDFGKWMNYKACIPYHDLSVVMRSFNIDEAISLGAQNVMRVFMSCDEVAHRPLGISTADHARFSSDVAFIGTWMPERGRFLCSLLRAGIRLSVWGDRWQRAPEWSELSTAWRGPSLLGDNYVRAIQCSKVVLGLLSKGNRDKHTQRTAEVPYIGSAFCAENTDEHGALFRDGVDAMLFNSVEEAVRKIKILLADDSLRSSMALNGRERILERGLTNEKVLQSILDHPSLHGTQD